jgi:hypothetical protein
MLLLLLLLLLLVGLALRCIPSHACASLLSMHVQCRRCMIPLLLLYSCCSWSTLRAALMSIISCWERAMLPCGLLLLLLL